MFEKHSLWDLKPWIVRHWPGRCAKFEKHSLWDLKLKNRKGKHESIKTFEKHSLWDLKLDYWKLLTSIVEKFEKHSLWDLKLPLFDKISKPTTQFEKHSLWDLKLEYSTISSEGLRAVRKTLPMGFETEQIFNDHFQQNSSKNTPYGIWNCDMFSFFSLFLDWFEKHSLWDLKRNWDYKV